MQQNVNGFSVKQQAVIDAVAVAPSLSQADAAQQAHLHRVTVTRWRKEVPAFATALDLAREEGRQRLLRVGEAKVAELLPKALCVLEEHLTDEDPRIRAQAALAITAYTLHKPAERHTLEGSEERPVTFTIRLDNPRAGE